MGSGDVHLSGGCRQADLQQGMAEAHPPHTLQDAAGRGTGPEVGFYGRTLPSALEPASHRDSKERKINAVLQHAIEDKGIHMLKYI